MNNDGDWQLLYNWGAQDDLADLSIGCRDSGGSNYVAQLQERLIALGYLTGKADGIFGERTQAALMQCQHANGMHADGVYHAGDHHWLHSHCAVARWDYNLSIGTGGTHHGTTTTHHTENHTQTHTQNQNHTQNHSRDYSGNHH